MDFDFSTCVKAGGKVYCWDRGLKSIVVLDYKKVEPSACPDSAVNAIMEKLDENRGR
jgi:hypothetical protein